MLRGNGGQDIFFDDEDRLRFYFLIQEGAERFGHRMHVFCLMDNHIHLNPVRAGLVRDAVHFAWSGHRAYQGREVIPWLTTDRVLSAAWRIGRGGAQVLQPLCGGSSG